jgi:hypothetical protein
MVVESAFSRVGDAAAGLVKKGLATATFATALIGLAAT